MSKIAKVGGIALAAIAVGLFIWPTPYVFTRYGGEVVRVNRWTGVEEHSTANGWVNKAKLAEAAAQRSAEERARTEEGAAQRAKKVLEELQAGVRIIDGAYMGDIRVYNSTDWSVRTEEIIVEYYVVEGGRKTFLCEHKPNDFEGLKPKAVKKFDLFYSWGPCNGVEEIPADMTGEQRITLKFGQARTETDSVPDVHFVLKHTRKW